MKMEKWRSGEAEKCFSHLLHYFITPVLHCSTVPLLHCSIVPLLHYSITPFNLPITNTLFFIHPTLPLDSEILSFQPIGINRILEGDFARLVVQYVIFDQCRF